MKGRLHLRKIPDSDRHPVLAGGDASARKFRANRAFLVTGAHSYMTMGAEGPKEMARAKNRTPYATRIEECGQRICFLFGFRNRRRPFGLAAHGFHQL